MIKPRTWFPYTWKPETLNDQIERNLEISIVNLKIAIVFALITLAMQIWRLLHR